MATKKTSFNLANWSVAIARCPYVGGQCSVWPASLPISAGTHALPELPDTRTKSQFEKK